ncbi:MAG: DNA polymerase I [Candidatus Omnitrophica bacterium]|nr:DNA polymerase I [Candidatus Omnitrophota bacterium]
MNTIFFIDANNIIYRSFFAIKAFTTTTGQPTNAVFGFVSTLLKILREYNPEYIAVVFDTPAPTFRHKVLEEYKIARKPMPPELSAQIPVIKEIIKFFGISSIEKESYEADDVIAYLALKFKAQGKNVLIFTTDKDILQLVCENIAVVNPATWEKIDVDSFVKKFGFSPENIIDFLALAGDSSDSIPGVSGIGEKTAILLVKEFGTIENLYDNLDRVKGKKKDILLAGKEAAFLSKKLVSLCCDVPIEISLEEIRRKEPDLEKISQIFQNLEFKKFDSQIQEIFGSKDTDRIFQVVQDILAIGNKIFDFKEILKNPEQYKSYLEDSAFEKIGSGIKDKIKNLLEKNSCLSQPYFDLEIASFLVGKTIHENDIFKLRDNYKQILQAESMSHLFHSIEMPLIEVLADMEMRGILVDRNFLETLKNEYENEMKNLQEKIYSIAGEVFNLNSPSQVATILFEKLGLPPKRKTKSGYSTGTESLSQLRSRHKIVDLILQYRELAKLCSTYIEGFSSYINPDDGRIHPEYQQAVASTGRLACRNPNLQAIPVRTERGGKIRKIFIAPENASLYSFDYNQIELRILAHFSRDPILMDAFENGHDIHLETAKQLFAFDTNSLFQEEQIDTYRRIAKTINFGIIYGMNSYGLASRLGCSQIEAQSFIDAYFSKFQGVRKYIVRSISEAEKNCYVKTLFGRKRHIPEITSENKNQREFAQRVAVNMPIQGTAAELIKLAMIKIHQFLKKEKMKSGIVLQIHDELVFEIYDNENKVVEEIKQLMENVHALDVPLTVDVQKGKNYLEMSNILSGSGGLDKIKYTY